jgi:NADPH2:quinone reductase
MAPVVDSVYRFDQAAEAHRRLEGGGHVGKVVLTVG